MPERYRKAPLLEAVIDLRVTLPEGTGTEALSDLKEFNNLWKGDFEMKNKKSLDPLVFDDVHGQECHTRWISRQNRIWPQIDTDIPEHWHNEQCGQCRFFIPIKGYLQADWGVCSNKTSKFDGNVMFEHDGCEHYDGANEWVSSFIELQE